MGEGEGEGISGEDLGSYFPMSSLLGTVQANQGEQREEQRADPHCFLLNDLFLVLTRLGAIAEVILNIHFLPPRCGELTVCSKHICENL